jgi:hypothetical protein
MMIKAKEHIVWRKKKKLLVLLDTKSGCYFTLNTTGQDLWLQHIVEGKPLNDVAREISRKYADPPPEEQILSDCNRLIGDWFTNQLIEKQD